MNAPQAFTRTTFAAWRLLDGNKLAYREKLPFASLAEIERNIADAANFGATIFVVEHDDIAGTSTLHAYRIRRGKWAGGIDRATGNKAYPYSADKLFALPVTAFEPTEPWRWSPGCDVVGRDVVIEGVAL